jgi:hypothetical protein
LKTLKLYRCSAALATPHQFMTSFFTLRLKREYALRYCYSLGKETMQARAFYLLKFYN